MDTALHVYNSNVGSLHLTTLVSILLLLIALGGIYWNQKRQVAYDQRNYRQLWTLLLGFVVLLAFVAMVFSWVTSKRIGVVKLYSDRLETTDGVIPLDQIGRAYLYLDVPASSYGTLSSSDTTRLLIVEESIIGNKEPKTYVFSEYNYPVKEMVVEINEVLRKVK